MQPGVPGEGPIIDAAGVPPAASVVSGLLTLAFPSILPGPEWKSEASLHFSRFVSSRQKPVTSKASDGSAAMPEIDVPGCFFAFFC